MVPTIDEFTFSPQSIALLVGCTPRTIVNHCISGELKCSQKKRYGNYCIAGRDFVEYLYKHPDFVQNLETLKLTGMKNTIKNLILKEIQSRPKIYSIKNLEDMFPVSRRTVQNWINSGLLEVYFYKHQKSKFCACFLEKSVNDFLIKKPEFRRFYTEYNEKRNKFIK